MCIDGCDGEAQDKTRPVELPMIGIYGWKRNLLDIVINDNHDAVCSCIFLYIQTAEAALTTTPASARRGIPHFSPGFIYSSATHSCQIRAGVVLPLDPGALRTRDAKYN